MAGRTFLGSLPALGGLLAPATAHALRELARGGAAATVWGRQFSRRLPGTRPSGFSVETDEDQKAAAAIRQMLKEGQVSEGELRDMIDSMRGDREVETEDVFRQRLEGAGGKDVQYVEEERILRDLKEIESGGRKNETREEEWKQEEEGWARKGRRRRMEKMQMLGEMLRDDDGESEEKGEVSVQKSVFDTAVGKKNGTEPRRDESEVGVGTRGRKDDEGGVGEKTGVLDRRAKETPTSGGYGESLEDIPLTPFGQPIYPKERETKKMMEVAARYKPGKYGHMDLRLAAGSKTWDPELLQLLDERSKRAVQRYYKDMRREPPPGPTEEFSLGRLPNPLADMGPDHRSTMVGSNILKTIKRILARDMKTNPIWDELNIEITGVRMKSRAKATVLWVNHGDYTDEQVTSMLELTKKNLRNAVQQRVNMKRAPEIFFVSDPGDTPGSNINLQLEEVERDLERMEVKGNKPDM